MTGGMIEQNVEQIAEEIANAPKAESIKTKILAPPTVEMGIKLIKTPEFSGFVCACGNHRQSKFLKFVSKFVAKDIKGHYTNGEKLYLRCSECADTTPYTEEINKHVIIARGGKFITERRKVFTEPTNKEVLSSQKEKKKERKRRKAGRPSKM